VRVEHLQTGFSSTESADLREPAARGAGAATAARAAYPDDEPPPQPRPRAAADRVQSLGRALDLLEHLAAQGSDGLPLGQLSQAAGLHPSTAHNLLRSLLDRGYVEQDAAGGRYRLGAAALTLAHQFLRACDLAALARPFVRQLAEQLDEQVILGVLQGGREHDILTAPGARPLIVNPHINAQGRLHCTSIGKVLLGSCSTAEIEAILAADGLPRYTPQTITSVERLLREVEAARRDGYATSREEHYAGVAGVAAPVRDATGRVLAGLGVPYPLLGADAAREAAILQATRRTAAALSRRLGYAAHDA
jgi:DNA-binding IclR family transcriptional regulator